MKRKIYNELLKWKKESINTPLMLIGARQTGKTYIVNEFCNNEFEKYIYINLLEMPEIIDIFSQRISIEERFNRMQLLLGEQIDIEKTIIFFDEIQESEELISALKFFCESEKPFKIICAGNLLGVKINRFNSSFPVGKVKIITLFPMDFEEFLIASENELLVKEIYDCYNELKPMDESLHEKLNNLYRLFLCVGGMPESVKNILEKNKNIFEYDNSILTTIYTSYLDDMNKYVKNTMEKTRIEALYKSIPIQLGT